MESTAEAGPAGWYVDERCTDCDVARQLAPGLVRAAPGRSELVRQPQNPAETAQLRAAALACPHPVDPPAGWPVRPGGTRSPFPLPLDENVLLCGHNSPRTAGANSYLLRRPSGHWMMVDTPPRYGEPLARRWTADRRITDVLLTHRDHAAHGRRWADRLDARLWIHEGDLDAAPDADRVLRGRAPTEIGEGVVAVPLPGHTRGSVLYLADERYCFSGDSFYWARTLEDLEVAQSVTWYSIEELAASLASVAGEVRFTWLLPGHGGRKRLPPEEMGRRLRRLAERAATLRPRPVDFTAVRW
ncbi:ferredoxin [Streptomyces sp. GKU 257-1]|nr:ferredoxin [Streptomyces sp. GKU 257-1]